MPANPEERTNERQPGYQPMVLLLVFVCTGILLDHFFDVPAYAWLALSAASLTAWIVFGIKKIYVGSILLLIGGLAIGGLWHHVRWNYFGVDDISTFATEDYSPVVLRAKVIREPRRILAEPDNPFDNVQSGIRTKLTVSVLQIRSEQQWRNASGSADLIVNGQVADVASGDTIEIVSKLVSSRHPKNPGEFDFYSFGRSKRRLCFVSANYPDSIVLLKSGSRYAPSNLLSPLRRQLNNVIWEFIEPEQASIASAILLGNRQLLSDRQFESFLVTGTIHILAISGLHVGIMAAGLLFLGRLGLLSRRHAYWLTMMVIIFYCFLVEFRPPVLRATVLVTLFCAGRLSGRSGFSFNILAVAGLIVLALNPLDLLNTGAQLSFLAVAAMSFGQQWIRVRPSNDPLDRLVERARSRPDKAWRKFWRATKSAYMVSLIIWLVAMPLVALRFHLVAPVAMLVNPLLLVPLAIALYSGFLTMILGWLFPPAGMVFGGICDWNLSGVQRMLELSREIPGSHFWTAGPSATSVIIFYALLFVIAIYRPTRLPVRWLLTVYVAWLAFGWFTPSMIRQAKIQSRQELQCTFIEVGHGTCVLVRLPDGKTMIYDCGSFGAPDRGLRNIANVLWYQNIEHIDSIVISHADLDHFNCLPELTRRFSIGRVYVSPSMLAQDSEAVVELFRILQEKDIKVVRLSRGDRLKVDHPQLEIETLGPPPVGTAGSDNSDSIVLAIRYVETNILLPGDLEGPGLQLLLSQAPENFDLVMAPHHGSNHSCPVEFVNWSNPATVVISGDDSKVNDSELSQMKNNQRFELRRTTQGAIQATATSKNIDVRQWNHHFSRFE